MKFILFHGSYGNPQENWLPELRERLTSLGQEVIVPAFPVESWDEVTKKGAGYIPTRQLLSTWLSSFDSMYKDLKPEEKLCFVGHSLGSVFILHVIEKYQLEIDCAIFVSPFLTKLNTLWQIDLANESFYKSNFDSDKLKKRIPTSYVLYSDNDPYVDKKYALEFAQLLDSSSILVRGAGHINSEVNVNEFPLVYELCKTRLDLSLYQKYMAHRKELYAVDYTNGKSEEVVYLSAGEIFDEGVFKFRNLKKSGFATFLTSLNYWDSQSVYYQQSRLAAQRIKNLTRVFIVDCLSDLKQKKLLDHMRLDIESGIHVFVCMAHDVKKDVPELDFGIWDNDYVCMVRADKNTQIEAKLSSRRTDIDHANEWKEIILKKSKRVINLQKDLQDFINDHE